MDDELRAPDGDPAPSAEPGASELSASASNVDRRSFFKVFGKQAFTTVGQVAGMADAVMRGTTGALSGIVELGLGDPQANAERLTTSTAYGPDGPGAAIAALPAPESLPDQAVHRSTYRLDGATMYAIDHRALPDRVTEISFRRCSDVAYYARAMRIRGGPLLAQLAAYGMALTAGELVERPWTPRQAEFRRQTRQMWLARPSARAVTTALDRLTAVWATFEEGTAGQVMADAIRAEADAIASEAALDHGAIARAAAGLLPMTTPDDRPLGVLIHGDPGALTSGMVGTALAAVQRLAADGRALRVWITETRPFLEGARMASWELSQSDIEHVVLPDSAVAWLLEHEQVDAVLLGAEWIAANGDTANVIGSRGVAELAAVAAPAGPVPVYVCAPVASIGLETADGAAIPMELLAGTELNLFQRGVNVTDESGLAPAVDVIPAERVSAIVTEVGVLRPPYADALAVAVAERATRRQAQVSRVA